MTAPINPIPLRLVKLDASSRAMLLTQIDRVVFASPRRQRRALINDWQRRMRNTAQPALT